MKNFVNFILGKQLFALLLGVVDGVLTALTLTSGKIIEGGILDYSLAFRIAAVTAVASSFIYFIAEYVQLRRELINAEKQLNIVSHGKFATTSLGKTVFVEVSVGMGISCIFGFIGALIPLSTNILFPNITGLSIAVSLTTLGLLGLVIARIIYANVFRWTIGLISVGIGLSVVGAVLHIV
ncbi:hypothetical protein M1615_03325 [Patescibacteria group bacterium]|nr:hypothetical protein [Patescibacteria group bacterium]